MFSDILYLYKNFLHWFLSKICISISRYVVAFLFALPLIVLLIIVVSISPYSFLDYSVFIQDILIALYPFSENFLWFTIWSTLISIILIVLTIVSLIAVFYNSILLAKLNFWYIDRQKLEYKKNLYLDREVFFKYLKISWVILAVLFLVTIVFGIWILILFFVFGWMSWMNELLQNTWSANGFSIISFIYFIICICIFLYSLYRLYFAYFILVDNSKKTIKQCILESFQITKWYKKVLKLFFLLVVLFIVYLPLNYIQQVIDFNSKSVSYYISMKEYVWNDKPNERLSWDEFYAFSQLQQQYSQYSDQELIGKENFMVIMKWLYIIFHFMFLYGVLDMLLASFYRRELLKK